MLLKEGDELAVGGHYWMPDDTGNEVWRLGEVVERGEDGNVSIKLDSGGVIDIDPVSTVTRSKRYRKKLAVCSQAETSRHPDFSLTAVSLSSGRFPAAFETRLRRTAVSILCGRRLPCGGVFPTRRWSLLDRLGRERGGCVRGGLCEREPLSLDRRPPKSFMGGPQSQSRPLLPGLPPPLPTSNSVCPTFFGFDFREAKFQARAVFFYDKNI